MTSKRKKLSAHRVATKTYYNYGVTPAEKRQTQLGNYANFVLGVAFTFVIYLLASALGV
jgi:hypothetical protein